MPAAVCIAILAVVLFAIYVIVLYNKLSVRKNQVKSTLSTLNRLFVQRADLIPNLILILKKHVVFDEEILQDILSLRNTVNSSNSKESYLQPEEGNSVLKQIIFQIEDDPELKFNRQFSQLKYAFTEYEQQITAERTLLGKSIIKYNNSAVTFPCNVIAKVLRFTPYT